MKNNILGIYEKAMPDNLRINEKLKLAKLAGFDFMEISIDESDEKLNKVFYPEDIKHKIKN
jgi:L-ribulose-5-phosphate 3-epimerase UlaE